MITKGLIVGINNYFVISFREESNNYNFFPKGKLKFHNFTKFQIMLNTYIIKIKQVPLYYCALETGGYFDVNCFIENKSFAAQSDPLTQEEANEWLERMEELFPTLELVLESID